MLEPPPTATITSAPDFLHAATPSVTFLIVGFGFISSYKSYTIPASLNIFSTFVFNRHFIFNSLILLLKHC